MDKQFHPTHYCACDYLFILGLKLIHCSNRDPWSQRNCISGIILCMCPANERCHDTVKSSLIGWAHTQNDPCISQGHPLIMQWWLSYLRCCRHLSFWYKGNTPALTHHWRTKAETQWPRRRHFQVHFLEWKLLNFDSNFSEINNGSISYNRLKYRFRQWFGTQKGDKLLSEKKIAYCQTSNISHTKSQNSNVSHLILQLSLSNPLKPGVKSRMKM